MNTLHGDLSWGMSESSTDNKNIPVLRSFHQAGWQHGDEHMPIPMQLLPSHIPLYDWEKDLP